MSKPLFNGCVSLVCCPCWLVLFGFSAHARPQQQLKQALGAPYEVSLGPCHQPLPHIISSPSCKPQLSTLVSAQPHNEETIRKGAPISLPRELARSPHRETHGAIPR